MAIAIRAVANSGNTADPVSFTVQAGDTIVAFICGRGSYAGDPCTVTCVWDSGGLNESLTQVTAVGSASGSDVAGGIAYSQSLTPGTHSFTYTININNDRCYIMALTGVRSIYYDADSSLGVPDSDVGDYAAVTTNVIADGIAICNYVTQEDDSHTEAGDGSSYASKWASNTPTASIATYSPGATGTATMRYNSTDVHQCISVISLAPQVDHTISPSGEITFSGALGFLSPFFVNANGGLTFSSALSNDTGKMVAGALTFASGVLNLGAGKLLEGVITFSGGLVKNIGKALAGAITFAGAASGTNAVKLLRKIFGKPNPTGQIKSGKRV